MNIYTATTAQNEAEKTLRRQGFKFANWISAGPEAEQGQGCMVMKKRIGPATHYREIDPAGNIN